MSVVIRGVKNTFRSGIRASAVISILAISMGLALAMLLANQAVKDRTAQVKRSVGTTVTVTPAGSSNFQGGGEPLTNEDIAKLYDLAHIKSVNATLNLMLNTASDDGAQLQMRTFGGSGVEAGETNLESAIDPGTLGNRFQGRVDSIGGTGEELPVPKLPVRMVGVSDNKDETGKAFVLTEGRELKASDTTSALVGKSLAEKNDLKPGSTFTAYDETFTVVGVFDSGTQFGNDGLYVPLATAQRVSEAGGEISNALVAVDSIDNVETAVANIKQTLGADVADVATTNENAATAVESLAAVEKVSLIGFFIALAAAAIIIFLTMLMIVRERRREIGVLKAIGGSNRSIVTQFVTEAVVLVMVGATLGMAIAAVSSNSIAGALVKSNVAETETEDSPLGGPRGGGFRSVRLGGASDLSSAKDLIGNVTTNVDAKTLGYGVLAAIGIAVLGSAIPAWLVTKVRPAEVLRGE
jgi:putative ABC transport system permease protein